MQHVVLSDEGNPQIVTASISDPYIAIKRVDGSIMFFVGDTVARQVSETLLPGLVSTECFAKLTV